MSGFCVVFESRKETGCAERVVRENGGGRGRGDGTWVLATKALTPALS